MVSPYLFLRRPKSGRCRAAAGAFRVQLHGARSIEESGEFVWVISYDGTEGLNVADAACHISEECRLLSSDPAEHTASAEKASARRVVRTTQPAHNAAHIERPHPLRPHRLCAARDWSFER